MTTIEEKAKRYGEALSKAKQVYKTPYTAHWDVMKELIEHLFPELAESEDERIRKELIEYIKDHQSSFISAPDCRDKYEEEENNKYNSWIAWLEKQVEKTEPIEDFDTEFERQISHLIASAINREHEYNKGYVKWAAQSLIEYAKREIEKQVGQKKDRVGCEATKEWGEDDDSRLKEVLYYIEYINRTNATFQQRDLTHLISWLKSLRPQSQWKPSDDEMEALAGALSLANNCGEESAFDLRTLYEQLKKLRGE